MLRSESGCDLLNAPDLSVPFKMEEFHVFGVGGGFVVVNHYGDHLVSVARVDIGSYGQTWADSEEAILYLHRTAKLTSNKCTATELPIGGAGVVLYFDNKELDTPENRRRLLAGLAKELPNFTQSNILCLQGSVSLEELSILREEDKKLKEGSPDQNVADAESAPVRKKRSNSLVSASAAFDCPVPLGLVSDEAMQERAATKSGAYSSLGAITTLLKAKKWDHNKIVLLGVTPLSCELYWLLLKESDTVFLSDPDPTKHKIDSKIPPRAFLQWDKAIAKENNWDILVFCSHACPTLDDKTIVDLNCKAVVSLSDEFLPKDSAKRENALLAIANNNVFEFAEGLCDLGTIAKVYDLAQRQNSSTFNQAFELGVKVMSNKLHLHGIITNDEHDAKRLFYSLVVDENMDDLGDRHVGLGTIMLNSSERMTDWMWSKAKALCPAFRALSSHSEKNKPSAVRYLDLGAGNGSAARFICKIDPKLHVTCIDVCPKQCAENRQLSDEQGLGSQIAVQLGSFERLSSDYSHYFDGCMSQDSFIHAFNKLDAFSEAFRVTKGGGWLMISDLMRGDGEDKSEELRDFVKEHSISNWATPNQCVQLAKQAGWAEVQFIDCTAEIKVSLLSLSKKIVSMIESGKHDGRNLEILQTHRLRLSNRIGQADRGVFKWGIIAARKPYDVVFLSTPPVTPQPHSMMDYSVNELDGNLKFGTDVVVVNIKEKLSREAINELPSTTRLIVTMSAGLDHICVEAAEARGIRIRRAARDQIVKSVADYLLSNVIFGLRNGFQNVGVPFPGASWNLQWNADGVDLDDSKIGFIGMGAIAIETARRLRALSNTCELVYHVPDGIRCRFENGTYHMYHVGIADLLSTCDVIIPMVPLTPATSGLINYSSFAMMKNTALFVNMARGKVVDTAGMVRALKEGQVRHAILDTTDPEPLPEDHELWDFKNCTITPHFATNTTYVRKELVEDIPNQVEDTLDERGILRLEEQRMRAELSDAYRLTREFGMDELVWNHISVLLSDGTYLITPGSRMFDDIGPQDLVKSSGNITADIIHEACYKYRSDIRAIVHLHTPATVAVSCLEMGFVPLAQEAAPFVGRVARHPWHGVSNDRDEQVLLGEAVKDTKYNTLLMENHGFCTFGRTLGEAWVLAYYFDKSCQTQLNCLQTGQKINYPSEKVLQHAAEQSQLSEFLPGACEWEALRKMMKRRYGR